MKMVKYVKLHSQFENFLETLDFRTLGIYEHKLINLIRSNFDELVPIGTHSGQRAKFISLLIEKSGKLTKDSISVREKETGRNHFPIKKILSLEVEGFRGFAKKENFSFDKIYTLAYGPNGSGKSSFCDALEYALLGYINEAIAKRIDVEEYVRNINSDHCTLPIVKALDNEGKIIGVKPAPDSYSFCFIEKNRIASFSRISANTPAGQRGLLATLFGLDEFNKFVMHFTDNFSEYIDIKGKKKEELDTKKKEINEAEIKIKSAKEELDKIEKEKRAILSKYDDKKTFEEIDIFLHGENTDGVKEEKESPERENQTISCTGRIKSIELELNKPISDKYFVKTYKDIDKDVSSIENVIKSYRAEEITYHAKKDAINYKKLYEAITDLEVKSQNVCPACQTPLDKTVANPFERARSEIKKLHEIAELEKKIDSLWSGLRSEVGSVKEEIGKLGRTAAKLQVVVNIDVDSVKEIGHEPEKGALARIETFIKSIRDSKRLLEVLHVKGETENNKLSQITTYREKLTSEKVRLEKVSDAIKSIKTRQKSYEDAIIRDSKTVSKFLENNKDLIAHAQKEKEQIVENEKFLEAYESVIGKLKAYNETLPLRLVENLNDLTKDFYNAINKNDREFELLSSIKLPVNPEGSIRIMFRNNGHEDFDALHVLSEGHIRCLGLAILLAKVVVDNKDLIIFDDVVNAIDDEHREGIRELLFKDSRIMSKQIILTSHAEEFIKDLDNQFKNSEYKKLVKRMTFLRPVDARSILVDVGETSFNYLIKAEECANRESKRDCLMNCRRALENITNGLWNHLGKTYKTEITVKIRSPRHAPDLMTVVQGLRKFMERQRPFDEARNDQIIIDLGWLEGLESTNRNIWNYLNKGTHEESEKKEFDKSIVEQILVCMQRLSNSVMSQGEKTRQVVESFCSNKM